MGSLVLWSGTQTHKWVLEGTVWSIIQSPPETEEFDETRHTYLSQLDIQCLVLKHPPQTFNVYEDEIQYLINHEQRTNFIKNLTLDLKGNTLVLFQRVESPWCTYSVKKINNNKVRTKRCFLIHGGVDTEEREVVREITERENDAIIVASYGTFSTGSNIKNLHNVIFAFTQQIKNS